MKKVFIATSSFAKDDARPLELIRQSGLEPHLNPLGRKLTEDEIEKFALDADFLISGTEPLTKRVLVSAKRLKIISRCGMGVDNIDLECAKGLGIKIYSTPDGPTLSVAELAVGLMLNLLRMVTVMDREVKAGKWEKRLGSLLNKKRVGIIGFGRIGQKVAEFLVPFGAETSYFDKRDVATTLPCSSKPPAALLEWGDIITLHCSAQGSMPVIGKKELQVMKKGAWLINTARGGLVDERALYDSLKNGHLAGAAFDVFETEPYAGALSGLPNVILTPHIGSYARESRVEMEMQAVKNLLNGMTPDALEMKDDKIYRHKPENF